MPENIIPVNVDLSNFKPNNGHYQVKDLGTIDNKYDTIGKYDQNMPTGVDQQEFRANNQGLLDKTGNALAQGLSTAATSFTGGTIGLANGAVDMLSGKDFFENDTFKVLEKLDKANKEAFPLYKTKAEREGSFTDKVLSDDFFLDSFFNGLGFVAGGWGSGAAIGKLVGKGLSLVKLGNTAKLAELAQGTVENPEAFANVFSKVAQKLPNITAATTGRIYESALEANQVYDTLKQKVTKGEITDTEAKQLRNSVFGTNMLLAIPEYFQYTKFLDNFSNTRAGLNKITKEAGQYAQEKIVGKQALAKDLGQLAFQIGTEGAEEGVQYIASKAGEKGNTDYAKEFANTAFESLSDPDFYASMVAGSLIGGVMGGVGTFKGGSESQKQNDYTEKVVDLMNQHLPDYSGKINEAKNKINSFYKIEEAKNNLVEQIQNEQDGSKRAVLRNEYRKLDHEQATNFVQAAAESDTFDDRIQELELLSRESDETLKRVANIQEDKIDENGAIKPPSQVLKEKIQQLKQLKKTYNTVAETHPNLSLEDVSEKFKGQSLFDFASKKETLVETKLTKLQGELLKTPENSLIKDQIEPLLAEQQYYKELQKRSIQQYNFVTEKVVPKKTNEKKIKEFIQQKVETAQTAQSEAKTNTEQSGGENQFDIESPTEMGNEDNNNPTPDPSQQSIPVQKPDLQFNSSLESKKADLKQKRQQDLEEVSAVINQNDKKFLEDNINKRYDAELAELKKQPIVIKAPIIAEPIIDKSDEDEESPIPNTEETLPVIKANEGKLKSMNGFSVRFKHQQSKFENSEDKDVFDDKGEIQFEKQENDSELVLTPLITVGQELTFRLDGTFNDNSELYNEIAYKYSPEDNALDKLKIGIYAKVNGRDRLLGYVGRISYAEKLLSESVDIKGEQEKLRNLRKSFADKPEGHTSAGKISFIGQPKLNENKITKNVKELLSDPKVKIGVVGEGVIKDLNNVPINDLSYSTELNTKGSVVMTVPMIKNGIETNFTTTLTKKQFVTIKGTELYTQLEKTLNKILEGKGLTEKEIEFLKSYIYVISGKKDAATLGLYGIKLDLKNGTITFDSQKQKDTKFLDKLFVNINPKASSVDEDVLANYLQLGLLKTKVQAKTIETQLPKGVSKISYFSQPIVEFTLDETKEETDFTQEETVTNTKGEVFFGEGYVEEYDDLPLPTTKTKLITNDLDDAVLDKETVDSIAFKLQSNLEGENNEEEITKYFNVIYNNEIISGKNVPQLAKDRWTEVIKHFPIYLQQAKEKLAKLGLEKDNSGFYEQVEESESSIDQMEDESAQMEDRKDTASTFVKKFLYFVPAHVKTDTGNVIKRNRLGLTSFSNYDDIYSIISDTLVDTNYPANSTGLSMMIDKLKEVDTPELAYITEKLNKFIQEDTNDELQAAFFSTFYQQRAIPKSITMDLVQGVKNFGHMIIRILNTDRASASKQIINEWENNYISEDSQISIKKDNKWEVNQEIAEDLNNKFLEISRYTDKVVSQDSVNKLVKLLNTIGIEITPKALSNYFKYEKIGKQNDSVALLNNKIAKIFKTLEEENSPFSTEGNVISSLAKYEYPFRKNLYGNSYRHGGKSYYSFLRTSPISELFNKLLDSNFVKELKTSAFSSESRLANDPDYRERVKIYYERGFKVGKKGENKELKEGIVKEHEVYKLAVFQAEANENALFVSDTHSDKTTKVLIQLKRLIYKPREQGKLSKSVLTELTRAFKGEYQRILQVQKDAKDPEITKIKDYDDGLGTKFNVYHVFNEKTLSKINPLLAKLIYEDGELNNIESLNNPVVLAEVHKEIEKIILALAKKTKEDWISLGIISDTGSLFDLKYINKVVLPNMVEPEEQSNNYKNARAAIATGKFTTTQEFVNVAKKVNDYAVLDYVINYAIQTQEVLALTGDPATQGKPKGTLLKSLYNTLVNIGKRNARLLAQGNKGLFKFSPVYKTSIVKDLLVNSPFIESYKELFRAKYDTSNSEADAQEFTTVQEHLEVMLAFGKINTQQFYTALYHYDNDAYNKLPESVYKKPKSIGTKIEALNIVMQPMKPVQVQKVWNPKRKMFVEYYIKTSSFPLVPDVIVGSPMEDILKQMKANGVSRLVFESGVKMGVQNVEELYGANGEVNENLFKNSIELNRDGFRIQLEVPFKEGKNKISEGTQEMKLLFVDLLDTDMIGNKSVKQLREDFYELHKELYDKALQELNDELKVKNGVITDYTKLAEILYEEGVSRGYNLNTLLGLEIKDGKFTIPLNFSPNLDQIQPVLTAIVSKRLTKFKITGKTYVQGSEALVRDRRKTKVESDFNKYKDQIIYINKDIRNQSKLNYLNNKNGIQASQIIMPFYFVSNGKKLKVEDYLIEVDGVKVLDVTKVPKELLEIFSFRVPTQGHNSMQYFEIAGFLPASMGDLVIVPSEIAVQMGSDFDVDKLFTYSKSYKVGVSFESRVRNNLIYTSKEDKNTVIEKEVLEKAVAEKLQEIEKKKSDVKLVNLFKEAWNNSLELQNAGTEKEYIQYSVEISSGLFKNSQPESEQDIQNFKDWKHLSHKIKFIDDANSKIVDIHKQLLLSENLYDSIIAPLNFDLLTSAIEEYGEKEGELGYIFDPLYQRKEYFDNRAGQLGVGVSANANTNHANSQVANLYIKGTGVKLLDKLLKPITDKVEGNSVNENNSKTYTSDEINSDNNDTSFRLDKVYTHEDPKTGEKYKISDLISQILGLSVDNAKEKGLGKGGINKHNFNILLLLTRTGFTFNWSIPFINQPILKEYYKVIGDTEDTFGDKFASGKRTKAVNILLNKYASEAGVVLEEFMQEEIKGVSHIDLTTSSNAKTQLEILKSFLHYENLSKELGYVQQSTNIDVKGNPINIQETVTKAASIESTLYSNKIFGNTEKFRESISGIFLDIPALTADMFSNLINYNKPAFKKVLEEISLVSGKPMAYFSSKQLSEIYYALNAYIFTSPKLVENITTNYQETKERLLISENSLYNQIKDLQTRFPNNFFLQRITKINRQTPDEAGLLSVVNSTSESDTFQNEFIKAWESALVSKDEQLKQFAKDLADYTLLFQNNYFGAYNLLKYIPFTYLNNVKFGESLYSILEEVDNEELFSTFTSQFLQHKPQYAKSGYKIADTKDAKTKISKLGEETIVEEYVFNKEVASEIAIKAGDTIIHPEFMNISDNGKRYLYKKTADAEKVVYTRVDTLGNTNLNEYNFSQRLSKSIYPVNQASLEIVKDIKPTKDTSSIELADKTNPEVLSELLSQIRFSEDPALAQLANELMLNGLEANIVYRDTKGVASDGTFLFINKAYLDSLSPVEKDRSILHEALHIATLNKLNDPDFLETTVYKKFETVYDNFVSGLSPFELKERALLQELLNQYKEAKPTAEQIANASWVDLSKLTILKVLGKDYKIDFRDLKDRLYGSLNTKEFISEISNPVFRKQLKAHKSLWENVVRLFKELFGDGEKPTLLNNAIDSIMDIVEYKKSVEQLVEQKNLPVGLGMNIPEFMRTLSKEARAEFRTLKEEGIIKTKC